MSLFFKESHILRFFGAGLLLGTVVFAAGASGPTVTFSKDVLPILQKNCQTCHRPGEIAPMSFLDYQSTRPWAKAIKTAVLTQKMPPWFADPRYGHWLNAPKLTEADVKTLAAWADTGAIEGDPKDAPAPAAWPEGWTIKPDLIVKMPKPFHVPAKGTVELTNFVLPTGLTEDTRITSIEVRPGNRKVVHHVVLSFRPHNPNVKYGEPSAPVKARDENGHAIKKIQPSKFEGQELAALLAWKPSSYPELRRSTSAW